MMIRQAAQTDLKGILALLHHLCPHEEYSNTDEYKSTWDRIQNHEGLKYFVAVEKDRIVACCNIALIPNLTRGQRPYALIENVITHPESRRKGYGRRVIKAARDYAKARNCYKVMLLSLTTRKSAHTFYENIGFDGNSKKGFQIRIP